jgi:hypothetical protein
MDAARNAPDSQDSDDAGHELQSQTAAFLHDETWDFASGAPADGAGSSSTPHVSLFSPSIPPILPPAPPDVEPSSSTRAHVGGFASPKASRSMPSLNTLTNMPKRTARINVSDTHPPIVQLHNQIPPAQKSGDDPTTPLEDNRKRTTMDTLNSQHTTMTSLSKLFSETTIPHSRAPSYNNATGPLYLRGMSIHVLLLNLNTILHPNVTNASSIQRRHTPARPPLHPRPARRTAL